MSTRFAGHVLTVPIGERDHITGSLDSPMQLAEYGDYECPACGMAHPVVEEVQRLLDHRLCFAFRHFPIVSAHPHALRAAEAAEAAGAQEMFWPMHHRLFDHQHALADDMLVYHAMQIGLDAKRFIADLVEHRFLGRIREDMSSGARSGVAGTPTFFVNGARYDGPSDMRSLVDALELTARARS